MELQRSLMELEEATQRISDGLSAIHIMALGLDEMESQYAGALYAVWKYLSDADQDFQKHLTACLNAV